MELVPYYIHPQVLLVIEKYKLEVFNIDKYLYDDIHENHEYLQSLDPKEWKEQDHYAVLRLRKVRINASQELIKQAYRKQLLDHHPDKGKQRLRKCEDENNDYFTCITRAYDMLKDQVSRNSYDSIDPEFDNDVPSVREVKERFYQSLASVFQRNSRWSKVQPVPELGDENTSIDYVHQFYNFWDDFKSWREFSYLDEEDSDKADCREERRYLDKLNKGERKKKGTEEIKRINNLVKIAKENDPRILKYVEERKATKEAEKRAKVERKLEIRLAAEKVLRDEKEKLEQEEAERQLKLRDENNNLKKQKEILKNRQKIEKRKLRKLVETYNNFTVVLSYQNDGRSLEMRKAEMVNIVEMLCVKMPIDDLAKLNEELEQATEEKIVEIIKLTGEKITGQSSDLAKQAAGKPTVAAAGSDSSGHVSKCGDREWTFELSQFLIKAINSHPPGTNHRWHAIADYMNVHHTGLNVKEKQVIHKAKLLKSDDSSMKKEAAVHNLTTKSDVTIVDNLKNVKITDRADVGDIKTTWSIEEQKLLELALKSVPASNPARWDKISELVQTRSKKECMLRCKECADKLKAKKAAQ